VTGQRTTALLVTPPARGGIAVIVLAGPEAEAIVAEVFRPRGAPPGAGRIALGWIVRGQEVLDEAVVACDAQTAEINIHAGPHVGRKVLARLAECGATVLPDAPIDPTFARAHPDFHNPAIAREMLAALRHAGTPLAASAVTAQWSGGVSALASGDAPAPAALRSSADGLALMRRLRVPAEVVIAGPPNVGKSALANVLLGRNVSIVSDTPGTTRDWVRHLTDADGVPFWLTDTAGLWSAAEGIEAEAVRRAWGRVESADVVVSLTAGDAGEHAGLIDRLRGLGNVIHVSGKSDALPADASAEVTVSATAMTGIDALRGAIRRRLGFSGFDPTEAMAFTDRQAERLGAAADAIDRGDTAGARAALDDLLAGNA